MYNEHIGRRNIASLTVPRKAVRAKKVVKIAGKDEPPAEHFAAHSRMQISFDMLDKVGHGTTLDADEPRLGSATPIYSPRGTKERQFSVSRKQPKSEADSLVEDIYGSIGTIKARPPPPAAPGVPRAPSVPVVPAKPTVASAAALRNPSSHSSPPPNPPPTVPAFAPPPPPPVSAAAPSNLQTENFYEDVSVTGSSAGVPEPIYQMPGPALAPASALPPSMAATGKISVGAYQLARLAVQA